MKEAVFAFLIALVVGAAVNGILPSLSAQPDQQQQPQASDQTQTQPSAEAGTAGGAATTGTNAGESLVGETGDATFENDVLKANGPVFVDFFATWCGPCKRMAPVVAELAGQYNGKVKFYKLDVDKSPSTAQKYQVGSIPTFIIFNGGKRGESWTGVVPKAYLADALTKATK